MEKIVTKYKDGIITMIKIWCCVFSHPDDTKSLAMDVKADLDKNSTRLVLKHKVNTNPSGCTSSIVADVADQHPSTV